MLWCVIILWLCIYYSFVVVFASYNLFMSKQFFIYFILSGVLSASAMERSYKNSSSWKNMIYLFYLLEIWIYNECKYLSHFVYFISKLNHNEVVDICFHCQDNSIGNMHRNTCKNIIIQHKETAIRL